MLIIKYIKENVPKSEMNRLKYLFTGIYIPSQTVLVHF